MWKGLPCLADAVAGGAEAVEVLGEREVVLVGGVGLDAGEDGVFRDEAGDVVDVAVGVVAGAAAVQPEGLVDAEVVVEGGFEQARVVVSSPRPGLRCWTSESRHSSVVRRMPAPLTSMEPPSRTMRWAFPLAEFDFGLDLGDVVELGDVVRDLVVAAPVVVLGPGVELPVGDGEVVAFLRSLLTKIGPESRSQTRSVGQWWKWVRARLAPPRRRMLVARRSAARSLTRMWTSSTRERWRTISA